ncbi:MAG: hypothetical protein LLG00_07990 [Planctomycetaceae bacterium]|nr:hypothetical protein [Planctomycetaceae bacterium]
MMTEGRTIGLRRWLWLAAPVLCLVAASLAVAGPSDPLAKSAASWQPPRAEQVKGEALRWLDAAVVDGPKAAAIRSKAEAIWADVPAGASEDDLLIRLARTFAVADPNAASLVAMCCQPRSQRTLASPLWLRDRRTAALEANNLRLLYASWLVHESLYDEAMEQLSGLTPEDVVAPATLLFHQSVVYHALLNKESGLKSLGELLQGEDRSPRRYVALARLMQDDLSGLETDTLDHIARRMGDIRRRLELGRAGPKVREEEDGVIKSLDKMIKKLEQQQQQQEQSSSLKPSGTPATESRPMGGKGPGEVTKKNIGSQSGWGDLPPKEREQAMQQIGRDFPSHYRDAIEQYFRRLAAEGNEE